MDTLPASTQGCFNWQALVGIPTCCLKRSPREWRISRDGERGEEITSPSSSSLPSSSSALEDPNSDGVSSPYTLAAVWAALLSHLLCFCACCLLLLAWLASYFTTSSGKVTPPPVGRYTHTQDPAHKHNRH
jgi:hypothetical protein